MLINLRDLNDRHHLNIHGVLHVGAHLGEEAHDYALQGITNVIWVEGNPELIEPLENHLRQFTGQRVVEALCSNKDGEEVVFHITSDPQNTRMSSSILELEVHKIHAPWVKEIGTQTLPTRTIDSLCVEHNIAGCNFINLDIQGAELLALQGAETFLQGCDYVYTEINTNYLYKDCVLLPELDQFLGDHGFLRLDTVLTPAEWGDAFYVRR